MSRRGHKRTDGTRRFCSCPFLSFCRLCFCRNACDLIAEAQCIQLSNRLLCLLQRFRFGLIEDLSAFIVKFFNALDSRLFDFSVMSNFSL
jgi:hypothetical protein